MKYYKIVFTPQTNPAYYSTENELDMFKLNLNDFTWEFVKGVVLENISNILVEVPEQEFNENIKTIKRRKLLEKLSK